MAKRPILTKAHDAATNNGPAITNKRVSIIDNPFEIFKLTTLYIIIKRMKLRISTFQMINFKDLEEPSFPQNLCPMKDIQILTTSNISDSFIL